MIQLYFAAEEATHQASEGLPLGLDLKTLIFQLITFVLLFMLLKKFAFKPIVKLLNQRFKVIEDGVLLGQKMEKEQAKLEEQKAEVLRKARHEADAIVATAHKEAREVAREAEKAAQRKADATLADAEIRIQEESERAKRALEKDIVGLVSEATEAIVGEKVNPKKDAEIIDKVLRRHIKK